MSKRDGIKSFIKALKDADDVCEIITGKRLADHGKRIFEVYGEEIGQKLEDALVGKEEELPDNSPYLVLHCRPDASDLVLRGRYRLLVREFHPDTGDHPDPKEFQRVVEAYNAIKLQRESK